MTATHAAPAPPARTPPRTSTLDRARLMKLAETEYHRFSVVLQDMRTEDWIRPTDCPGWDVRAIAGHALGMAEMSASVRDGRRQQKAAAKRGGEFIDDLTALQVEEHAKLSTRMLTDRYVATATRAARARRRTPWFIRRRSLPIAQNVGGKRESWTIGYLVDTVLTRDPWMHRIDIGRATGRPPTLSADHDGVLVADVVTEWAGRHGRTCQVELTGPAGGSWTFGAGGPRIEMDAIEFCRTASGRETGTDLMATEVPF